MKKLTATNQISKLVAWAGMLGLAWVASAQNLVQNPNFTAANGSASGSGWNSDAQGIYFYSQSPIGNICSIGWNNGDGIWQNTGAAVQLGASYALDVTAEVGQAPMTGLNLSFQDVTAGWTMVANRNFTFANQTAGGNSLETFELDIPASALTLNVGDTIGVGVLMYESPSSQQGWAWIQNVSLTVVPEPTSLALLAMGGVGTLVAFRRRQA